MKRLTFAVGFITLMAGCAQNTETPVAQVADQNQSSSPVSRQYDKTAGHVFYVNACNTPTPTTRPATAQVGGAIAKVEGDVVGSAEGVASSGATYFVYQRNTINVGNNEMAKTGTVTGSSTGTQTPTQTVNANPVQTVEPTMAVPVTVGLPGSATSGQATATGREGASTGQTASPTQTPNYTTATLTGTKDQLTAMIPLLQSWIDAIAAKLETATAPAQ